MRKSSRRVVLAIVNLAVLAAGLAVILHGRKGNSQLAGQQVRAVSMAIDRYARSHSGCLPTLENRDRLES
ncbi:MAG TPA: hypothetical protein VFW73_08905 [Lacipirellulaceae bacterium]|nr:hypothetical protein [Lacipirellulaceae bacterium]